MEGARIEASLLEGESANRFDICLVMVKLGANGERRVIQTLDYGCNRFIFAEKEINIISVEHDLDGGEVQDREASDGVAEVHG